MLLDEVANGATDKEAAPRLGMSYRTLRTHLERLYARFGVHNKAALAAAWRSSPLNLRDTGITRRRPRG
jgi:DNA-binding CsgD family transcriptional regulator